MSALDLYLIFFLLGYCVSVLVGFFFLLCFLFFLFILSFLFFLLFFWLSVIERLS